MKTGPAGHYPAGLGQRCSAGWCVTFRLTGLEIRGVEGGVLPVRRKCMGEESATAA